MTIAARRTGAMTLTVVLCACGPSPETLDWNITFASSSLRDESAHVSAFILRGGCNGTERVYETSAGDAPTDTRSEALAPGVYGFAAEARDDTCAPIAYGCVEVRLPSSGDEPVAISLDEARTAPTCAADVCAMGTCMSAHDASVDAPDASTPDDAAASDCPEGMRRPGGRCYRYYDLTTDYTDGRELCWLWNADLAVFDDAAEEAWVRSTFAPMGDYWVGVTDAVTEGTWLTVAGFAPTYVNWDPADSAGNTTNNCARYYLDTGMWRDIPCANEYRVVCERP